MEAAFAAREVGGDGRGAWEARVTGAALRRKLCRLGLCSRCIVACAVPEDAPAIAFKSGPESPQSTPAPSKSPIDVYNFAFGGSNPAKRPQSGSAIRLEGAAGETRRRFSRVGQVSPPLPPPLRFLLFWFIKHCFFILFMFFHIFCFFVRLVISHPSVSL
jgi:hypothetical protein